MFDPIFLYSLISLALVILAGWFSRKTKILGSQDARGLSAFVYNFGLPALFFSKLANLDLSGVDLWLLAGSVGPLVILFLLVWLLWLVRLLTKERMILLGISVLFGSNAFYGIPFFESLYGDWGLERAVITAALLGSFGIVATLTLFEYATHENRESTALIRVLKSPLILSIFLGLICSALGWRMNILLDALALLGKTASGTAIFMIGMYVYDHFSWQNIKKALPYTLFRVFGLPVMTIILIIMVDHSNSRLNSFLFLQSGIPAAVSIAIFAERYRYKIDELTGVVVLTALMSFPVLSCIRLLVDVFL